ncbi:uncharacterized protein LOC111633222 isoform X2 [Centruroides sculpturatus]|uniref:uncharacterized protein LOC111633222 isoform X1 n=1 Tax=Centruroides sculpturatus TaxID=218467 RepID=UPI000C6D332F|nr:uncharacterized protein LOC111633222 isoform X1 [Centruroides sculpturatus]XP_023233527.1 uncharacterized protein LOC111633222 isoform X1 [Centruroides sculpturatus]XP_023233528.1 uncharacterized protein LOC111633222 isoform X2 [Centruroides sculpturatus]
MVVSDYFSYMKKHGLIRYVSLEEMAKNYERKNGNFPTVMVDISDVDTQKYINTLVPYPWNYHTLVKKLREYVQQFRDKHIEPCFYIWGRLKDYADVKVPNKYTCNNKRNGLKKLKQIRNDRHSDSTCYAENTLTKIYWFSSFILKYDCGCQVINVTEKKYAKLAKIAKDDDRCLGILTSDSRCLIYNTKPVFYHVPMKLVSTLTEMYLPNEFLRKIDLNSSQLKLLFSAQKDLLGFKFANLENDEVLRIEYLKNAIKDNNLTGDEQDVFVWSYITEIRVAILRAKMELYDEIDNDDGSANYTTLSKFLKQKWNACESPAKVYYVVKRQNYVETFNLSDFTEESLPFSISLYDSMRRNMYFALLRQENCKVRELWISEPTNINIEDYVTNFTTYEGFIPTLEILLSDDSSVNEYRWKLLFYCLGKTTSTRYSNTPIFAFCCVINYMLRNGVEFRQYELDALILQAILVSNNSDSYNNNTEWNRRFVHLSRLYETGMNTLMNVLTACGFPISLEHSLHWKTFNILVFSNVYYELICQTPLDVFCKRNNIDISYYKWIHITCLEEM